MHLKMNSRHCARHGCQSGLLGEAKGVADAEGIDGSIFPARLAGKWIIRWDGAVRIQAQDFALKRLQLLRGFAGRLFPEGDIQKTIGAKTHRTTLMPGRNGAAERRLIVAFQ